MKEPSSHTDKEVLSKGIQIMLICLILMFLGPTLIHISFSNQEKRLFLPLLIFGILISFGAIFTLFKGIKTITDSMFGKRK